MRTSPLMLNWFSSNLETPDCGVEIGQRFVLFPSSATGQFDEAPPPDDGIANSPFGSRALSTARETGLTKAGFTPNVAASAAAVRFVSVKPRGIAGNVRLFASERPLRSRVPWYDPKKNARSLTTGPPSVNPYWLRERTGFS